MKAKCDVYQLRGGQDLLLNKNSPNIDILVICPSEGPHTYWEFV